MLTILLFIEHSSRCKLKVYKITHTKEKPSSRRQIYIFAKLGRQWKSKEWAKFELECLLLIFISSNSKFKVTSKNADFEYRYIRIHTKEKPSKISTCAILLFHQKKKILKLNCHREYLYTTLDETIRCASKWFILTWKLILEMLNFKCATYAQHIPLSFISIQLR